MKAVLLIMFLIYGCGEAKNSNSPQFTTLTDSSTKGSTIGKNKQNELRKSEDDIGYDDNAQLEIMLKDLLKIADRNKEKNHFYKEVSIWNYQGGSTDASLSFGYLFSNKEKYLIIRRIIAGSLTVVDIFVLEQSKFRHLLTKSRDNMGYIDDSIKDVNGDDIKDFLFHWYPSSGCCRRDIYDVFLYNEANHKFSDEYEFINPTFSSKEKVIRGIEYGHPGSVPLYKYKWNGAKVDTIEFIYPDTTKGKFYLSKVRDYDMAVQKGKVLKGLPKEYRNIESIDWFLFY
jgi:hypothetical protein